MNLYDIPVTTLAGQPATAWKYLWEPLCLAALNTPPGQACATSFRAVLQGAFAGRREHSDLLLPRHDLGALFPEPAAARLRALGGEVVLGRRVRNLSLERDRVVLDGDSACDGVVLAVAPWHAAALLQPLPALAAGLAAYPTEAIATAYLRYPASVHLPKPMLGLAGGPGQYAFDRGASHGQHGLIAVVASAANGLAASPREAWLARIADQAEALLGARPVWARGVLEKRATWACVPGLERPPIATPHPRLVLAGDYTAGPYPATLESACCSGVQSAHTLLRHLP